jgi:TonB-dependent receptor
VEDDKLRRSALAQSIAFALGTTSVAPTFAQETASPVVDEIVVTGVRESLERSMAIKRDSDGVVDAIVAEDIGKFPDTNLAESLQRITGVSIDRTGQLGAEGEGQRITVRGIGPDFNLVLLNGRQMPTSSLFATNVTTGRSFDFSNLASEAVTAVEVYKTGMSSIPTGGIGATINIRTARPLEVGDRPLSIGAKAVHDTSDQDDAWTPEVSGIYSGVFADGKFGIAVSAIYQEREFGYNQAGTAAGWIPDSRLDPSWQALPDPGGPFENNYENLPSADDLYSLPQNILYSRNDVDRDRLKGQLVLQWAPTEALDFTLDYTYSELEVQQRTHDISAWFIQCGVCGGSTGSFTDGPIVAPLEWSEDWAGRDVALGGGEAGWKTELDSIGFNGKYSVNERLGFALDYHSSTSESKRASPFGSNATIGVPGFYGIRASADYSSDFPVLSYQLPGDGGLDPSQHMFSGAAFRSALSRMEIEQATLSGYFELQERMGLDFGVSLTDTKNRTAFRDNQYADWGGIGGPEDIPDDAFTITDVRSLFDNLPGSGSADLFNEMFLFDFADMAAYREQATGAPSIALDEFNTDLRTEEESTAAYLQWRWNFDLGGLNSNLRLGMRYEQTDITSSALVPIPQYITWDAANEYSIVFGEPDFTNLEGDYEYWLPNVDFNIEVAEGLILRASYGETIGRQAWDDIQGGQTLNPLVRRSFGNAATGDPNLKPLESKNYDLSAEWYYSEGSYISAGYFLKDVKNYVAVSTVEGTPFELPHPGNGLWYDECNAATGNASDQNAIRDCILATHADSPSVDVTTGKIQGVPGQDPAAVFLIATPANQRDVEIDGWELAVQHLFGESGFGMSANYTMVDADIGYDDGSLDDQFAILGLSDSANVVGFYDKNGWIVRLAWNWRDEFLSGTVDGNGIPNPVYTEEYAQLDAIVSYTFGNGMTVFAEGFNLTDEYLRLHSRTEEQIEFVTQLGPRYGVGFRWVY